MNRNYSQHLRSSYTILRSLYAIHRALIAHKTLKESLILLCRGNYGITRLNWWDRRVELSVLFSKWVGPSMYRTIYIWDGTDHTFRNYNTYLRLPALSCALHRLTSTRLCSPDPTSLSLVVLSAMLGPWAILTMSLLRASTSNKKDQGGGLE